MEVKEVEQLKPIIELAIKSIYGKSIQDIELLKATQIPIFDEEKELWRSAVEFINDIIEKQEKAKLRPDFLRGY